MHVLISIIQGYIYKYLYKITNSSAISVFIIYVVRIQFICFYLEPSKKDHSVIVVCLVLCINTGFIVFFRQGLEMLYIRDLKEINLKYFLLIMYLAT